MKKLFILFSVLSLFLTACEFEASRVVVDDIDLEHQVLIGTDYIYRNGNWVKIETEYNYYTVHVEVKNRGDFTAYNVEVDIFISATNGESFTETHYIGELRPNERAYITQDEVFSNTAIDEYSADVYWVE